MRKLEQAADSELVTNLASGPNSATMKNHSKEVPGDDPSGIVCACFQS